MDILPGQDTLLACWRALAQTSTGARMVDLGMTAAAVFPSWRPLNNAIVLGPVDGAAGAVSRLAGVYADAGVDTWALWWPSCATDLDAADEVRQVGGLMRDTTTLVMQSVLGPAARRHGAVVRTSVATATRATEEAIPVADLDAPDGVPGLSAWVLVVDGVAISGTWSFLRGEDCGIYTVGTLPAWRRRGFARALVGHVLADAWSHGARRATLQSTRMGQQLYESLGFTPAGRYEEWIYPMT